MAEREMKNYALRDKNGNEVAVFTGKAPRQAALRQPIEATPISNSGRKEQRTCMYFQAREFR